jgi:queuine tRNA-ribosyltransferase
MLTRARTTTVTTLHGAIETPVFMPVGTRASVRTQTLGQLHELGTQCILANTYHLMLRPGIEVFEKFGGLHKWMGWNRPILTDSGGFQLFSLAHAVTMSEEGATLRPHEDGPTLHLTPEGSIGMQRAIGSDIMMVLDHCIASTAPHAEAKTAMDLTHRWARRSLRARGDSAQKLFAIVQGACFEDLRRASAADLTSVDGFDGYAIGGLAVGEERSQREDMTELVADLLPRDKPRYLMGVGTPLDLLEAVHRGVDMFDCILPTAWAQQGVAFTSRGKVDLRRGIYKMSADPLDAACDCDACRLYSRSYVQHLVKCKEALGWSLISFHNLRFYARLMAEMRAQIAAGTFAAFHAEQRQTLGVSDLDFPPGPPPRTKKPRPTTRGFFAVHDSPSGWSSIQHVPSGEIMHSVNHPDVEAAQVYVAQSALIAQALAGTRPLVVWDVGLGAAHNAMALLRALDAAPGHGAIDLHSFEHDLDALRLALSLGRRFPHLRHEAPHMLAKLGSYRRDGLTWTLHEGDFLATYSAQPRPDVVFYDPFSQKTDTPMWSLAAFRKLFAHVARPAEVFTFTSSTPVRSSLLAAGFHVARGVGSGPRDETTIAIALEPGEAAPHVLLGRDWLARRSRSSAPFGADIAPELQPEIEQLIVGHAQFR